MTSATTPLLIAKNLVRRYGSRTVVDDVSFTIPRGRTLGIVGESGSGKSTIARMALNLLSPTSGSVCFDTLDLLALPARALRQTRRRMSFVFQDPFSALNPRLCVRDLLTEPFLIHREHPAEGLEARLASLLAEVGLDPSALPRLPHQFSGGQRQRINIARALALRPELLVLDEPVSALDVSVAAQVINLLRKLQRDHGLSYLFISHSMPLVRYLSDQVLVLQSGRVVEEGGVFQVCDRPSQPYTQQLLAATPELHPESSNKPQTRPQESPAQPLG